MNSEDKELNEFIIKIAHKIKEAQADYNDLSDNNKKRADQWALNMIQTQGIMGLLNYLNSLN